MAEQNSFNFKESFKEFGYYLVNFFLSILIGLGVMILLDVPMKFIKGFPINLGHFIIHFFGMCIALYIRSYHQGYDQNTRTYTFQLKKTIIYVGIVFAVQAALILIIGGHAIYITGPTTSLTSYLLPAVDTTTISGALKLTGYNWLFMILADVFIYAPIMVISEHFGAKRNLEDVTQSQQK